jgi:hypothetical protein
MRQIAIFSKSDKPKADRVSFINTVRLPLLFSGMPIVMEVSIILIWGGLAPLDNAAVATGKITLMGRRKTILSPFIVSAVALFALVDAFATVYQWELSLYKCLNQN